MTESNFYHAAPAGTFFVERPPCDFTAEGRRCERTSAHGGLHWNSDDEPLAWDSPRSINPTVIATSDMVDRRIAAALERFAKDMRANP